MTTEAEQMSVDASGLDEPFRARAGTPTAGLESHGALSMRHFELVVAIASFAVVFLLGLIK